MRPNPRPQEIYRHFKGNIYQIITLARHSENGMKMVVYQQLYAPYEVYVRPLEMFMSKIDARKYPNETQIYRFEKIDTRGEENAGTQKETSSETLTRVLNRGKTQSVPAPEEQKTTLAEVKNAEVENVSRNVQMWTTLAEVKNAEVENVSRNVQMWTTLAEVKNAEVENVSRNVQMWTTLAEVKNAEVENVSRNVQMWTTLAEVKNAEVENVSGNVQPSEEEFTLDQGLVEFLDADTYEKKLQILSALHPRITDAMIDTMAVSLDTEVKEGDIEMRYNEIKNCLMTMERFECNRLR